MAKTRRGKGQQPVNVSSKKKHRFPLRIDATLHNEIDALSFRHNVSLNVTYNEAILYASTSDGFHALMQNKFPRDVTRGYYVVDSAVVRTGRFV